MFVIAANEGDRRADPDGVARVRRRRHAAGRRDHQARPRPRRLRRRRRAGAGGVRRQGRAGLPARGRPPRRAAHRRPRPRRAARRADRGGHRGVRGRVADGPLPRRRGDRPGPAGRPTSSARSPAGRSTRWSRSTPRTGVGAEELLDLVVAGFPSPLEHPLPEVFTPAGAAGPALSCDPDGPLVAEIVKTTTDPYVGRVSLVRVFSGTVRPDAVVHVSGHFSSFFGEETGHPDHDEDERIGALSVPLGKTHRPADSVIAGDICAIARLSRAETGDTLSDKDNPLVLRPWNDARAAAAAGDPGPRQGRRGQALPGAPAARRRGPDAARRAQRRDPPDRAVVHGRGARRRGHRPAGGPLRRRRRPGRAQGAAARDVRRRRRRGTAGTSSSPAATGSTPSATSRSSRCRRARASSSSTRSSAARCRASSSRRWRRGSGSRWRRGSRPATRWSTSG